MIYGNFKETVKNIVDTGCNNTIPYQVDNRTDSADFFRTCRPIYLVCHYLHGVLFMGSQVVGFSNLNDSRFVYSFDSFYTCGYTGMV